MSKICSIWEQITNECNNAITINTIEAPSLEEAARLVMNSNDVKYAFRTNRELIDISGRFRLFSFKSKSYVLKIVKSKSVPIEYINACKANKILSQARVTEYYVPIPLLVCSNDYIGLLTEYYGCSLYENCKETANVFSQKEIALGFRKLLELGIEWDGWLPRNIILHEGKLILIDWERAIFNRCSLCQISTMTLYKLVLGWSQVYGSLSETKECFFTILDGYSICHSDLDEFESVLASVLELNDEKLIRDKAINLTFDSEGPSNVYCNCVLSFMDIGHIIDEMYSTHISILYTCCSGKIRKQKGDTFLLCFLNAFINIFVLILRSSGAANNILFSCHEVRKVELLLILYLLGKPQKEVLIHLSESKSITEFITILVNTDEMIGALIRYLRLQNCVGLENAVERAQNMHVFLEFLYEYICVLFPRFRTCDLLLRGSCGQKIMTVRSDVDFEVSGPLHKDGFRAAENIICDILNTWGIRQSFREGKVPMHYNTMLGYGKGADGKPEIVPEEAELVKEIYHSYLTGMSLQQIADSLNMRGITTKSGKSLWKSNKIQNILTNEKYTGDALLQKTYTIDCISKKSRKNNGELPMYLVKNHHEPIIPRTEFNRVQEEMARRKSKRKVAEKFCKTEQGKYSAKYALTELLVCGECGTPYRRVTWTAKGFKEIKWRCINRLQYGKKKCHNSPTLSEEALHKAIVTAINNFCEVKDDVAEILRESIAEVLDPTKNGSVLTAQQRLDELANNMNELLRLATTPENSKTAMADIQKFSDEMKALREFIETEKAKAATAEHDTEQMNAVLERLEQADFTLTEYDDVVVRQMVEKISVIDKQTIRIRFIGGMEITQNM